MGASSVASLVLAGAGHVTSSRWSSLLDDLLQTRVGCGDVGAGTTDRDGQVGSKTNLASGGNSQLGNLGPGCGRLGSSGRFTTEPPSGRVVFFTIPPSGRVGFLKVPPPFNLTGCVDALIHLRASYWPGVVPASRLSHLREASLPIRPRLPSSWSGVTFFGLNVPQDRASDRTCFRPHVRWFSRASDRTFF